MMTQDSAEHVGSAWAEHVALDARLDEALVDTFPASDPVAITVPRSRPRRSEGMASRHAGGPA